MSYFLCLGYHEKLHNRINKVFDPVIIIHDASSFPIGISAIGDKISWKAVLLQTGFDSHNLIGIRPKKSLHNSGNHSLLIEGIQRLLQSPDCPYLSMIYHCFIGHLAKEVVPIKNEISVSIELLQDVLLTLSEDTRVLVIKM